MELTKSALNFFSFVAKWMRTRHRPKEFAFLLLFSLTYKFVHGLNATYAVRMCFELIERTMMTTTTAAATAIPPITSSAQCCSRCCCYCCRCGCCNYMCTYWVWFKRWERERQSEREWEKNRILRERMQKGKLACVCMCEQGIPSCVSRVFFLNSHHTNYFAYTYIKSMKTEPEYLRKKIHNAMNTHAHNKCMRWGREWTNQRRRRASVSAWNDLHLLLVRLEIPKRIFELCLCRSVCACVCSLFGRLNPHSRMPIIIIVLFVLLMMMLLLLFIVSSRNPHLTGEWWWPNQCWGRGLSILTTIFISESILF